MKLGTTVKRVLGGAAFGAALTWSAAAFPCGGAFGPGATVDPSQQLLVSHKGGTESYVFRPHFCGESTQFGLILPVPDALSKSPELGDPALFDELATLTAPKRVKQNVCKGGLSNGAGGGSDQGGVPRGGVDVVDRGQVGIFDWVLVKADSKLSFTEWLDTNGFPHDPSADPIFEHYVTEGWSFVAFKVTAGPDAPPAGKKLCGDFGPIELAFPTAEAVIPTRIASVSAGTARPQWRIYGLTEGKEQLGMPTGKSSFYGTVSYSDALSGNMLATSPQLAKHAAEGDRLVRIDVGFGFEGQATDLHLASNAPSTFHSTFIEPNYVDCPDGKLPEESSTPTDGTSASNASSSDGGCAVGGERGGFASYGLAAFGVAAALGMLRRRRSDSV